MSVMDMQDRELLELAARAAGITITGVGARGIATGKNGSVLIGFWNPLEDDGDAFRLANHLGLTVGQTYEGAYVDLCSGEILQMTGSCQHEVAWLDFDGDKNAASRRAIVFCAAQIGSVMPC